MPTVVDEGVVRAYEALSPDAERIRTVAYRWGGRRPARSEDDYMALDLLSGGVRQVVQVADRLGVDAESRVMEIGCGLGGPLRHIAARYGCRMTGVDITPRQLAIARALSAGLDIEPRLEFVHADARDLPIADRTFSHAYSIEAFVHISDKAAAIREARRVLAPGGRLLVRDFVVHDPTAEFALFDDAVHPLALDRYVEAFGEAGFEDVQVTDYTAENREAYALARTMYGDGPLSLSEATRTFATLQPGVPPPRWQLLAPGRLPHVVRYLRERSRWALELFGSDELLRGVRQMCDDIVDAYDEGAMSLYELTGRKPAA